jgi:hypothetical protein
MSISLSYRELAKGHGSYMKMSLDEWVDMKLTMHRERGEFIDYTDKDGKETRLERIDHHPELKEYEVWCEGYAATGEHGTAHLYGKVMARNFAQACDIIMCKKLLDYEEGCNAPDNQQYYGPHHWSYDTNRLSVWGCSLYPREDWARLSFG